MMKEIEAIYERGILRPVEPLELPEGTRLELILLSRNKASESALPLEGSADPFSGRDHDSILYPEKRTA